MNFETKTKLMTHQREAVAKMLPTRVGALFMDMGTGKTLTAVELAKIRREKISRVVWFCPVSLKKTVYDEIIKHTNCTAADINMFDDKTNQMNVPDAQWHICGIESMSSSDRTVLAIHDLIDDRAFVVVDEATYIKGHRALRTKRLISYAERARYRLILTGTPLTQGIVDLYSQMQFLSPKILGYKSFYSFANNHLEYSEKYPGLIVSTHNTGQLAAKIAPYVYQITKDECLDLPDKVFKTRYFSMTAEQRDLYVQAKLELLLDVPDDYLDSSIAIFRLFSALQQITCGFWSKSDWSPKWEKQQEKVFELVEVAHRRTAALLETVRAIPEGEKVIIWAKYHYDVRGIVGALKAEFPTDACAEFHGKLPAKKRNAEIDKFRNSARFLVATPSSGGHGLTLNEANYVIFYNNGFKYSERLQAEDRNHRIGQTSSVVYTDIACLDSIDERIITALHKKENVLKNFQREVGKVKKERLRECLLNL